MVSSQIALRRSVARAIGGVAAALGVVSLWLFPALKRQGGQTGADISQYQSQIPEIYFAPMAGGLLLVWGLSTLATGEWKSLTPRRAMGIPAAVAVPWLVAEYFPTVTFDPGRDPWTAPPTVFDAVGQMLRTTGGVFVAGTACTVIAVAVARNERRWVYLGAAPIVAIGLFEGAFANQFLYGFASIVVAAPLVGLVPIVFGYLTADPPDVASSTP